VNGQTIREAMKAALEGGVLPDGWQVTLETSPDLHARTLQIGHAELVEPTEYRAFTMVLPVTLWVDEGDTADGVVELYELLSPGSGSIFTILRAAAGVPLAGPCSAGPVGRRDEGPSGFLAVDIRLPLKVT